MNFFYFISLFTRQELAKNFKMVKSTNQIITRTRSARSTKFLELGPTSELQLRKQNRKNEKKTKKKEKQYVDACVQTDDSYFANQIEKDIEIEIESDVTELDDLMRYRELLDFETEKEDLEYWKDCDFDDAHEAWMENKRKGENGTYYYICGKIMKNGIKCVHAQCDLSGVYSGCKRHYAWEEKLNKLI